MKQTYEIWRKHSSDSRPSIVDHITALEHEAYEQMELFAEREANLVGIDFTMVEKGNRITVTYHSDYIEDWTIDYQLIKAANKGTMQ